MGCSNCGSNLPCGCSSQVQTGVGRTCVDPCAVPSGCDPNNCCQPSLPATPIPFYACTPNCPESHTQTLVQQQFYFDISAVNTWNIPTCGNTAVLAVPGIKSVNIGSYIWNSEFGYFEITAFDVTTGQITILNHCNDGNAAPGTNVPACTLFTVTVVPCDCGSNGQVCVAIDFTAPDVDNCIDITLSATTGLAVSDTVQIGSGLYFVSAIKPNDIITICNEGDGITPGTPVIALNGAGDFQYCLSIIASNPCATTPITSGNVLACNGDEQTKLLTGTNDGHILTLVDTAFGDASYQTAVQKITSLTGEDHAVLTLDHTTINTGTPTSTSSATTTFNLVNDCLYTTMNISISGMLKVLGNSNGANTDPFDIIVSLFGSINGGGFVEFPGVALNDIGFASFFNKSDAANDFIINSPFNFFLSPANLVPASGAFTLALKATIFFSGTGGGSASSLAAFFNSISIIGVIN